MTANSISRKIIVHPHPDIEDILPGYLNKRKAELIDLKGFLNTSNFDEILTIGHNVKGTAKSYGLSELGMIADKLEKAAALKDASTILSCLHEYEEILQMIEIASPLDGKTE